ncbi:MAG: threonine synthase, partial [Actinobacteria bacterium]|nr:threonine synthase [Actinomycetota bacterium]NIX22306.1 threonine synthase [Actinomycetota bacterium]
VPEHVPELRPADLASLRDRAYPEVALTVAQRFVDDIPEPDLRRLVGAAYAPDAFTHPDVVSIDQVEPDLYLAGLS